MRVVETVGVAALFFVYAHVAPFVADIAPGCKALLVGVLQYATECGFTVCVGVFAVDSPLAAIV